MTARAAPQLRIHTVAVVTDGGWAFRDSSLSWRPGQRMSHAATFDPFPAYPHDLTVVTAAAGLAASRWAPLWDVDLYSCDREEISRSSAHSHLIEDSHYEDGEYVKDIPRGVIVLSGKRVMPHPAMSRHLAGHEYGHNAAYMINFARGAKYTSDCTDLYREYAAMRGLPETSLHHGDGGNWHDAAGEILACDFRMAVCGLEAEYWPHPGIRRPEEIPGLVAWWKHARAEVDAAARRLTAAPAGPVG